LLDENSSFEEAFFNGTIEGYTDSEFEAIMTGAKFSDIVNNIRIKANKINANVSFSNPTMTVSQDDPWNVKITFGSNFVMEDLGGLASWDKTQSIIAYVPIVGFQDPSYFINTGVDVSINQTPYTTFTSSTLQLHAENTFYLANIDAPSFLDRLEGNIAVSNTNGIESLAVPKLSSISGRSIVDHEYFSGTGGSQVSGMPIWFIIDSEHQSIYQP